MKSVDDHWGLQLRRWKMRQLPEEVHQAFDSMGISG